MHIRRLRPFGSFRPFTLMLVLAWLAANAQPSHLREESFDREPPGWEGINNRNSHFRLRTVTQDFGYDPRARRIGNEPGQLGGKVNPAAEPAYYAYRFPQPLSFNDPVKASGKMLVSPGPGHFLFGLFNATTLNEWRTRNSMVVRVNGRGETFHCHIEYCTSRWRCEAGVIGEIVRGERIDAKAIPSGGVYEWRLSYDPQAGTGGFGN